MFFDKIKKLPKLEIGNRVGRTDYIDFLKWNEVNEPAMYGTDKFGRTFVVIKFILNKNTTKKPIKIMQTFFKRYSYGGLWMGCGHATNNLLFSVGSINVQQFEFLDNILNGKEMEITNDINSFFDKGTKVELYDKKKEAAIKIQKHWKICRYNPKYKMCEKVQSRNFDLINQGNL